MAIKVSDFLKKKPRHDDTVVVNCDVQILKSTD